MVTTDGWARSRGDAPGRVRATDDLDEGDENRARQLGTGRHRCGRRRYAMEAVSPPEPAARGRWSRPAARSRSRRCGAGSGGQPDAADARARAAAPSAQKAGVSSPFAGGGGGGRQSTGYAHRDKHAACAPRPVTGEVEVAFRDEPQGLSRRQSRWWPATTAGGFRQRCDPGRSQHVRRAAARAAGAAEAAERGSAGLPGDAALRGVRRLHRAD